MTIMILLVCLTVWGTANEPRAGHGDRRSERLAPGDTELTAHHTQCLCVCGAHTGQTQCPSAADEEDVSSSSSLPPALRVQLRQITCPTNECAVKAGLPACCSDPESSTLRSPARHIEAEQVMWNTPLQVQWEEDGCSHQKTLQVSSSLDFQLHGVASKALRRSHRSARTMWLASCSPINRELLII